MKVDVIVNNSYELAEGPVWDEQAGRLYWVDIMAGAVHWLDPATGETAAFRLDHPVGAVGLRAGGGLVAATGAGFVRLDLDVNRVEYLVDPEADRPRNRFNDGKPGPAGEFWAGTMDLNAAPRAGSLYRLDPDGTVQQYLSGVTISNGLAWSADAATMYYIDTTPRHVYAFAYDRASGRIANQRVIIEVPASLGTPDGMTIDDEGKLWIAHWGGAALRRWDPATGRLLESIPIAASQVTCPVFGGPNMDTLYVTTAAIDLSPAQRAAEPLAGALFALQPGVSGRPAYRFQG